VVEAGSFLGANVTVLPGVRVGAGSFVAAGSVVTADVPPRTLVAGVPARPLRAIG
jgi:galactoside O-acetyltransferase